MCVLYLSKLRDLNNQILWWKLIIGLIMPKGQGFHTIYRFQKIVKKEDLLNINFKKDGKISSWQKK